MSGAPSERRPDAELEPELARVAAALDRAAALEAQEMREAQALAEAPGSRRVEEALAGAWGAAPRARRRWRGLSLFALAAGVLAVSYLALREPDEHGPRGEFLGDGKIAVVRPGPVADAWDRIEWSGPADTTYRVLVRDAADGAQVHGPVEVERANVLTLPAEANERWPTRIVILLEHRDLDGTWVAAPRHESQRR